MRITLPIIVRCVLLIAAAILCCAEFAFAQAPFGPPPLAGDFVPAAAPEVNPNKPVYQPPPAHRPPPRYPPQQSYPPRPTANRYPPATAGAPATAPAFGDASLVGSRYAPASPAATPPASPQTNTQFRPTPPEGPTRPIQYPIAQQPGEQILASAEINEDCKVFARIGGQVVLGSEFLPRVDQIMESNKDRIPAGGWETQRLVLIKQVLETMVENKLVVADARRKIPEEALPNVEKQVDASFLETQVPKMMADAEVKTKAELDAVLIKSGSSLAAQRRIFFERALGSQWVRQSINTNREVTHGEMWKYYQEHRDDYRNEAKSKWQELHVSFTEVSDRGEAFRKIAQMGNDVVQRNVAFDVVAGTHSNGLTAKEGGFHNWTTKGSLKSERLDTALFDLPINQLSPIIEDTDGYYIVRVLERKTENYTPFREAQVEIAEKIKAVHREEQVREYYAKLRREIPVWTIFDDPRIAAKLPETYR